MCIQLDIVRKCRFFKFVAMSILLCISIAALYDRIHNYKSCVLNIFVIAPPHRFALAMSYVWRITEPRRSQVDTSLWKHDWHSWTFQHPLVLSGVILLQSIHSHTLIFVQSTWSWTYFAVLITCNKRFSPGPFVPSKCWLQCRWKYYMVRVNLLETPKSTDYDIDLDIAFWYLLCTNSFTTTRLVCKSILVLHHSMGPHWLRLVIEGLPSLGLAKWILRYETWPTFVKFQHPLALSEVILIFAMSFHTLIPG